MKDWKSLIPFLILYLLFAATLLTLIWQYEKGELHLLLNGEHTEGLDLFFRYFTEVGGSLPVIIGVAFILSCAGRSLYLLVTVGVTALITNGLKNLFAIPRPKFFFAEKFPDVTLQLVEGVQVHMHNGFPSGHTSAVFAVMLGVALLSRRWYISLICAFIAILGAYSRVYLSQHFAEDILFGSVVGVFVALLLYPAYLRLNRKSWAQWGVIGHFESRRVGKP